MGEAFLTAEEERALIKRSQAGDVKARNTLVERNYGLIFSRAASHARMRGGRAEDYLGEATIAYIRSIDKFDLSRGFRLSTLAQPTMFNALNTMSRVEAYVITVKQVAQMGKGSPETVASARKVMNGVSSHVDHIEARLDEGPPTGPCYDDAMQAASFLPFEMYVALDRSLNGWPPSKIGALLGCHKSQACRIRKVAVQRLRDSQTRLNGAGEPPAPRTRSRRRMSLSNTQILRVLMQNLKVVPAVIDAVTEISEAEGVQGKADGIKHLIDLLVPVIQDLEPLWTSQGFSAAGEADEGQEHTFASAGIDWDALLKALPVIVSAIEMVLQLLNTSKESK